MANEIERHDGARAAQELGYVIPACGALGKAMQQHDRRGFGSLAFPDGEAVAHAIMLEEPLSFRHGAPLSLRCRYGQKTVDRILGYGRKSGRTSETSTSETWQPSNTQGQMLAFFGLARAVQTTLALALHFVHDSFGYL